ncbi:MAG: hypothetical protein LAQ69_42275 [Acidobacteriia bacterium]|nr:hypothetical protein [Terriglobia bacterium]
MRIRLLLLSFLVLILGAVSCSTGPARPQPGTPAYSWASAQEAYRKADFQKTNSSLLEVIHTDNEFTARARPWQIIVSAGVARGFSEMADSYEAGGRANRENPMPFHKQMTNLRSMASGAALEFAEGVHAFMEKDKDPDVRLTFEYPAGAAAEPTAVGKVSTGMLLQDSERDSMQTAMLERGVLLSLCRAVDSPDDPAKTLEKFKAGEVRVPRNVFLFAAAKALHEQSELFSSKKLDQPVRAKLMDQEALEALQSIPETKETKALAARIQASLKKMKST